MEVMKYREVEGHPVALLIVDDVDRLGTSAAELMTLVALLAPESARWLMVEAMSHSTHLESVSLRVKRGTRAAKERRKKEQ